jgi:hypothetical protein
MVSSLSGRAGSPGINERKSASVTYGRSGSPGAWRRQNLLCARRGPTSKASLTFIRNYDPITTVRAKKGSQNTFKPLPVSVLGVLPHFLDIKHYTLFIYIGIVRSHLEFAVPTHSNLFKPNQGVFFIAKSVSNSNNRPF